MMSDQGYVRITRNPVRILLGPGPLPKVFRNISGFDRLPAEELARHGWHPFAAEEAPGVDSRTHKVVTRVDLGDDGVVRAVHDVEPLSEGERAHQLAESRRARLAELAAVRWQHETGGITFDGIPLHTDRGSQAAIALAALRVAALHALATGWKGADGHWYALSPEQLQAAAEAVAAHTRACFAREEELAEAIRGADSIEALDAIDLEAGWPSN